VIRISNFEFRISSFEPKGHSPMQERENNLGKVFIVGAGPGAVDLITLRGMQVLRQADVVLYDALVNPDLLSYAPPGSKQLFVGKRCGRHSMRQSEINRLIIEEARQGKTVVRLKGGDPLIFARGGEEALACATAGLDFEIIPGVSSALGAASYAGIPLTHRGLASSVAFVTAHGAGTGEIPDLSWKVLGPRVDTLVIFMGASWLEAAANALMESGLPSSTPVAVVSKATCEDQVTILGALADIAALVRQARVKPPMLIIVGAVTRLSETLNWFENHQKTLLDMACAEGARL
jgi:uroporphyrin-III C-methyltransferase